jgi:hypothetical protein
LRSRIAIAAGGIGAVVVPQGDKQQGAEPNYDYERYRLTLHGGTSVATATTVREIYTLTSK